MRRLLPLFSLVLLLVPVVRAEGESSDAGFRALSGSRAQDFALPADMKLIRSLALPNGATYQRFQQVIGNAEVLGAQVTLLENRHRVALSERRHSELSWDIAGGRGTSRGA
jgi:hypothetical protein